MSTPAKEVNAIEVTAKELPVFCPNRSMPVWSHHPRVFLDISKTGEVSCPYCGTRYVLKNSAAITGH